MKKQFMAFLTVLAVIVSAGIIRADDKALQSEEEIISYIEECRADGLDSFEFVCDEETYGLVSADGFSRLMILEKKYGIKNADIYYNSSNRLIELRNVSYEDVPWAECADEDEVRDAVLDFGGQGLTGFRLFMTKELCESLYENDHLYMYGALTGIGDMSPRFYTSTGLIEISGVKYSELPYAYAADEQAFLSAVESFASEGTSDFYICFEPEFFDALSEDSAALKRMQGSSVLETYYTRQNRYKKTIEYTEATFSDVPRSVCDTEADIVREIRTMGAAGAAKFNLILNEELYQDIKEENFTRLHELETEAGLTSCNMSYNWSSYILYYENAVIRSEVVKLETMDDVISYMMEKSAENAPEITLFCSEGVYDRLMEGLGGFIAISNSMAPLYDVSVLAGLQDFTISYSQRTHVITFEGITYYPGTNMVRAYRNNDATGLTDREMEAMQEAVQLAHDLKTEDPLTTARNIHDYIAANVVYTDDENTDEDDNAIGALLNGKANCDGYSDAFYAVGTLAGLNIRYQHGDSYQIGMDFDIFNKITHMWNLIEIDGTWRLVDVTWDDEEEAQSYTWFNLGYDRASRMHIWNEDTSVELDPVTDLSVRPENEYCVLNEEDFSAALDHALENGYEVTYFIWEDPSAVPEEAEQLDLIRNRINTGFRYFWNYRMLMFTLSDVGN